MNKIYLFFMALLLAAYSIGANIEYCKIKYSTMLVQQNIIPTADQFLNPFYKNYYHVFLKNGQEILSFEPNNKERVSDDMASLGNMTFSGADCETISTDNIEKQWLILRNYFNHQLQITSYDTMPNGLRKNGHLVAKEAISSIGLNAKIDLNINSDIPYNK